MMHEVKTTTSPAYASMTRSIVLRVMSRMVICAFALTAAIGLVVKPAHAQSNVGINVASPDPSAVLEMLSTTKGFLIPRMSYAQKNAIASPKLGLLVFQTDSINATTPMTFYYWDGTKWVPFLGGYNAWRLTGNSGTNPSINFLGTIDSVDFVVRTNNRERARFYADGNLRLVNPSGKASEQFQWTDSTGGHLTSMRARYMTRNIPYTLPDSQGSAGQVLTNDGAGNLYWDEPGAQIQFSTATLATWTSDRQDLVLNPYDRVIYRVSASFNNLQLGGIAGSWNGRLLIICNVSTSNNAVTVQNEDVNSAAANRILTGTGNSVNMAQDQSCLLVYDGVSQRWRMVARSP